MTVPSYTEDLTDLDTAESSTNWTEMNGTATLTLGSEAFNAQGIPAGADGDYPFIQGSYSVTADCSKDTAVGSLAYNNGSGTGGHGTDGAYLIWQNYMVASNIQTYANDGFMVVVGSGGNDFDIWTVGGVDTAPYPYGGWVNHAVNTSVTADFTAGTPTATEQYIGAAVFVATGSSKGEAHNVDVIRYGRCSSIFEFGEAADYATIAGYATQNDNNSNRWGLIQETSGGYLWKGRMQLGTVTNAVDFRDSNVNVFVQWCPKVTANFSLIECINTASNIEMTGFNFLCLDTTSASQGRFLMTDQCDVALDTCAFTDMDTFVFDQGGSPENTVTITDCTFTRCALITAGGGTFTGCIFDEPTGTVGVTAASPAEAALVSNSTFNSDGTGNGLEITGTAADMTLTNIDFTGYSLTTDADKAIYVNIASGTMTLNITGGSGVTADSHVRTAGATVTVVSDPVTTTVNTVEGDATVVATVRVRLVAAASSPLGPLPVNETVTITRAGSPVTASVSHTGHGLSNGQKIEIDGANEWQYNGVHTLQNVSANAYDYPLASDPGGNATGTITATAVILYEDSNGSGVATDSRTLASDQLVTGWGRLSTTPGNLWKEAPLNGTISSTTGLTLSAVMIPDE